MRCAQGRCNQTCVQPHIVREGTNFWLIPLTPLEKHISARVGGKPQREEQTWVYRAIACSFSPSKAVALELASASVVLPYGREREREGGGVASWISNAGKALLPFYFSLLPILIPPPRFKRFFY